MTEPEIDKEEEETSTVDEEESENTAAEEAGEATLLKRERGEVMVFGGAHGLAAALEPAPLAFDHG